MGRIMISPEIKFNVDAQHQFDFAFPPEEVKAFEDEAGDDWIDMFGALETFGFPVIKPEGKVDVFTQFVSNRHGNKIVFKESETGPKVYRRNITPLLWASLDIALDCQKHWTKEYEDSINKAFLPQRTPTEDWQR